MKDVSHTLSASLLSWYMQAKQRAEAVTAPQQMQVTNNASALGGNGSPAGPAQAASPGSAQPAASVAWPAKDTDVELLQALLKEILSVRI